MFRLFLVVIAIAAVSPFASAQASGGPGTLQEVLKSAETKATASRVAGYAFRNGQIEAMKSLQDFPDNECVENDIMAAEALMELNSATSCLRAQGFAYEYKQIPAEHCRLTSNILGKSIRKALKDSTHRCMQLGYSNCMSDRVELTPTTDGYCLVRVSAKPAPSSDTEPMRLVRARDLLVQAREFIAAGRCSEAAQLGVLAKSYLAEMRLTTLPDYPSGKMPAYICDDF